jgi:predicted amidohydrolase
LHIRAEIYPERSTEKACQLIGEAAQKGAALAAFGENWLPGYPWWLWGYPWNETGEPQYAYLENSVEIPGSYTDRICQAAGDNNIDVAIGVAERDKLTHGTVYNTLLFIGSNGKILGRHRKLKPTSVERLVWGEGDGAGLRTYQRPYARIGGLNCMEHGMMLPAYALAAQGMQVHVAAWPYDVEGLGLILTQAVAIQSGCYAIAVVANWKKEYVPEPFQHFDEGGIFDFQAEENKRIGSCIIDPYGEVIAKVSSNQEAILTATVSLEKITQKHSLIDIGGHYARPDVLQLHIDRKVGDRVVFVGESWAADNKQTNSTRELENDE